MYRVPVYVYIHIFWLYVQNFPLRMALCTTSTQNGASTKIFINRLIWKTTNIIYLWYHEIIIRYVIHWGKHSNLDCNFLCFTSNVICLVPINVITYKKFLYGNWASANTKTRFMSQYAMLHTILRKRGCKALFCMHDTNAKTRPWIKWAFKMPFFAET